MQTQSMSDSFDTIMSRTVNISAMQRNIKALSVEKGVLRRQIWSIELELRRIDDDNTMLSDVEIEEIDDFQKKCYETLLQKKIKKMHILEMKIELIHGKLCGAFTSLYKEELISKTCHPDRMFQWNEDFCSMYPDEYKVECERFNNIRI